MAKQFLKELAGAGIGKEPAELRALAIEWVEKQFPQAETITTGTLQQWMEENPEELLILDTRTPSEFDISHLPGATRISPDPDVLLDLFKKWLAQERGGSHRHIVCYCTVGYRSSSAVLLLDDFLSHETSRDFITSSRFYNVQGGLVKWAAEQRPMVDRQNKPTHVVHPYSSVWAKLLEPDFKAEM